MTHVKIFSAASEGRLQHLINSWLDKYPLISIVDIKFDSVTASSDNFCFIKYSAMIIYKGNHADEDDSETAY